jgi:hypothetical protein
VSYRSGKLTDKKFPGFKVVIKYSNKGFGLTITQPIYFHFHVFITAKIKNTEFLSTDSLDLVLCKALNINIPIYIYH